MTFMKTTAQCANVVVNYFCVILVLVFIIWNVWNLRLRLFPRGCGYAPDAKKRY